jgi:propanol-preferring alcohol dehydrogenase
LDKENLCESARFTGYHADGGYAEYAVAPEAYCYGIPPAFTDVEAAPLLCAGIIGYRALKRSQLPSGGKLGLYGFGSSAHVVMQIAKHRGSAVYVVTRGEKHRQLARQMGAAWVGEDARQMPLKVDSAIIFAPAGELVLPALEALQKGGTLALAGIYMTPIPAMDYQRYVFYERDIHSVTCNTRSDGRELLAEAAAIPIHPHTAVYPLADANRALMDLKHDRISGTGVLSIELP